MRRVAAGAGLVAEGIAVGAARRRGLGLDLLVTADAERARLARQQRAVRRRMGSMTARAAAGDRSVNVEARPGQAVGHRLILPVASDAEVTVGEREEVLVP